MQTLKKILKTAIKIFFDNLLKVVFGATVLAIIATIGGIFHVYQTIWTFGKILLQSSTPVWATIALVFLVLVYIYLKIPEYSSVSSESNREDIEIEKLKLENRKEKIKQWREDILKKRDDSDSFFNTSTFHELKGKLTDKELIFATGISYGKDGDRIIHADLYFPEGIDRLGRFLEIVSDIEKDWGII
jgi:hypothetical protein